jgi:hypothetical protein
MKRTALCGALLALGLGCNGAYESAEMKLRYQPPHGVKLVEEQPGPPRVARFSSGFEIRSVDAAPPAIDPDKLDDLLPQVSPGMTGSLISSRAGELAAGKVVRFTLKDADKRSLIYFLPLSKRYVVLTLTAPENRYAELETQLELSLSSLHVHD